VKDGSDISETLYFTVDLTLIDNTVQKNFELQNARPEVVKSQFAVNKKRILPVYQSKNPLRL
jgi:hypothetical protein